MAVSMPRHDEPRAPVTEAEVVAHLARSRKPQSLREIAAALGLAPLGTPRAGEARAKNEEARGDSRISERARWLAQGKTGRAIRAAAAKRRAAPARLGTSSRTSPATQRGIAPGGAAGSESIDGTPRRASRRLRLRRAGYAAKRFGRRSFHRARRDGRRHARRSRAREHRAPQALWRRRWAGAPKDASCA